MNEQIRLSPLQLVDEKGDMVGEVSRDDALQKAREAGLDLVEVSPDTRPPIVRIMDYGKAQYERKKKRQTGGGPKQTTKLKQIRLRAKTGEHDIDFKVRRARKFLQKNDKVKINVMFRGRENAHHERGREMLTEISETLGEVASVERPPSMENRRVMTMVLAPKS